MSASTGVNAIQNITMNIVLPIHSEDTSMVESKAIYTGTCNTKP